MELARYRDMFRIYLLVIGAFSITFFVRWVMIGYLTGGALVAAICSGSLLVFLLFGILFLYWGLEKWDRFYSDLTAPQPPYPFYAHHQPVYYQPPAYYHPQPVQYPPPAYYYPQPVDYPPPAYYHPRPVDYPPPAHYHPRPAYYPAHAYGQPAYRYPQDYQWPVYQYPQYYPPPGYRYPQAYPPPGYRYPQDREPPSPGQRQGFGQPARYRQQPAGAQGTPAPPAGYAAPQRYIPRRPAPRVELDPRRALILPDAMKLLSVFLAAVLFGGIALLVAPYTAYLSLFVFLPAFIIGFSFPSLIWISYVYGFEKAHVLPSKTILKALVYGMLSTIPALLVNTIAAVVLGEGEGASLAVTLATAAVVAPLIEEFSKPWGVVWAGDDVRGRLDGLILGVTCGVGFALIENITYEFSFVLTGAGAAALWTLGSLARGLGSIMVHATGAGLIGYAYGRYRANGDILGIGLAYLLAVGIHSAWNGSSALLGTADWGIYALVPFMVLFVVGAYYLLRYFIDRGAASEERGTGEPASR